MSNFPSIDSIRKQADEKRSVTDNVFQKAEDDAFDQITSECADIMNNASRNGKPMAYLKTWEFTEDKNDMTYSVNGVKWLDIMKKTNLLERLKKYFDPEDREDGY